MADVTSWVGIVVFACGIYCLYATILMKTKGEINQNILLGREYQFKKCKDTEAYIREMFPHLCLFAIVTTLSGLVDMINSFITDVFYINIVMMIIFIVELIVFSRMSLKLKKKYY